MKRGVLNMLDNLKKNFEKNKKILIALGAFVIIAVIAIVAYVVFTGGPGNATKEIDNSTSKIASQTQEHANELQNKAKEEDAKAKAEADKRRDEQAKYSKSQYDELEKIFQSSFVNMQEPNILPDKANNLVNVFAAAVTAQANLLQNNYKLMQEKQITPYVMYQTLQTVNANLQNEQTALEQLKSFGEKTKNSYIENEYKKVYKLNDDLSVKVQEILAGEKSIPTDLLSIKTFTDQYGKKPFDEIVKQTKEYMYTLDGNVDRTQKFEKDFNETTMRYINN